MLKTLTSEERCKGGARPVLFTGILCCFVFHGVELVFHLQGQER